MRMRDVAAITMTMMAAALPAAEARADGAYFGVGIGGAWLAGDLDRYFEIAGVGGVRFVGGVRLGDTAFELSLFGATLADAEGGRGGYATYETDALGLGVKQYVPLGKLVSILDDEAALLPGGFSGGGFDLGTGFQLDWRWRWPESSAVWGFSVWTDFGIQHLRLTRSGREPIAGTLAEVTVGWVMHLGW